MVITLTAIATDLLLIRINVKYLTLGQTFRVRLFFWDALPLLNVYRLK
jgi:hypothetical protein